MKYNIQSKYKSILIISLLVFPIFSYSSSLSDFMKKKDKIGVIKREKDKSPSIDSYIRKKKESEGITELLEDIRKDEKKLMKIDFKTMDYSEDSKEDKIDASSTEEKSRLEKFFRDVKKKDIDSGPEDWYYDYYHYYLWRRYYSGYRNPYYYPYDYPYGYPYGWGRDYPRRDAYESRWAFDTDISLNFQRIDESLFSYGGEISLSGYRSMGFSLNWTIYEEFTDDGVENLMLFNGSFLYKLLPVITGEIGMASLSYFDETALGLKLGIRAGIPLFDRINIWLRPDITFFQDGIITGFDGGIGVRINSFLNVRGGYRIINSSSESLGGPSFGLGTNFRLDSSIFR